VPWLHGIGGHRVSLNLARELADRGARVDYLVGRMNRGLMEHVSSLLGDAQLTYLGVLSSTDTSIPNYARYQYSRKLNRELAKSIAATHRRAPYDLVLVIANEGHWLPSYLRGRLPPPIPILAVCVRELVEHPFWLGYERKWSRTRRLLSPLYPLFHDSESERLQEFDRVYSNSPWTSFLLDYFYGIRESPTLAMIDRSFFEVPIPQNPANYVAVPTASLDRKGTALVQKIALEVPNLRTFGRTRVPGIPHEGFLPDFKLVSFLAAASATLFVFDYEALGLIPIESLAAGTPVATIPKQGPRMLLTGNPGVRFGITAHELAEAIAALTQVSGDPSWRSELRKSVLGFHPNNGTTDFLATLKGPPPRHVVQ
jgi:hypothetical protein